MPNLAIITGATSGLGYQTALGLARANHDILLTGRNPAKGAEALARLKQAHPNTQASYAHLDVSSLTSVKAFATTITQPIAILVNNAGVMALPRRTVTEDGFEAQLATNHLGHFALVHALRDHLRHGRVIPVSSVAHRRGRIAWDDLQSERNYQPFKAYAQSKLANLMFAQELQRRSTAQNWAITAIAAHPGWAATSIVRNGIGTGLIPTLIQAAFSAAGQSAADGARPILHAALSPDAQPGAYYGPCCWAETRGHPAPARIFPQASNPQDNARLWDLSAELTGA